MAIYCPQCGTEAAQTQQFCRKCGVNLSLIGKALNLSESIARGDRGPLPKVKEIIGGIKIEAMTDEIGRGLEQMNTEIVRSFDTAKASPAWDRFRRQKTPEERYEKSVRDGMSSIFGGVAAMIALYYLAGVIVLKVPPDALAKIPFELEPVVRMIWLLGLIPALQGFGQLVGALMTKPAPGRIDAPEPPALESASAGPPISVTEGTTSLLDETAGAPRDRQTE
jgi:hypothetical protein